MPQSWIEKVKGYCEDYNIPLDYLSDTLYEPKVIPMIRGKAFEFSAMLALQRILPPTVWEVKKEPMNAQLGFHDTDVLVVHRPTNKMIKVECKLAKKESFRLHSKGATISIKCMRSRTLGPAMVKSLAPRYGKTVKQLSVHNDQYLPGDFDVVITSIGNAFYRTNKQNGRFEWVPSEDEKRFLETLGLNRATDLKELAFNQMFLALSSDLVIDCGTKIKCTRRRCSKKKSCGFIPNYPLMQFAPNASTPNNGWVSLRQSQRLFERLV